ncbi:YdgA family protein [Xenorhabdus innexi]|uniref:Protein ydgA n=1 Tax=Xenorhabdus innexi TaxID=290109 RepID=A0A1N6MY20_9GAMM|nr:YdgA family protein [Xenorhabdus innexi]PHM38820.1 hypothetical protein Xinn_00106 [Xenorhabdus innexi]SIP73736.1 conserved exported hypothetical protein [Xenorhabdus innexi]
MKKSLVAVGVIVALGAVWTGASWYTGKQVEVRMDKLVKNTNEMLTDAFPNSGLVVQVKNFQRGIFSSDANFTLSTKNTEGSKTDDEIIFKSHIDHGPFPASALKGFSFIPALASAHTEIEQNDATKKLFEITDGKSLFNIDARIGYSGNISSDIEIIPVEHTDKDGVKVSFSGAQINTDVNRDLSVFSFTAKSDDLTVNIPSEKREITLKGVDFKADYSKGKFGVYLGDHNYTIGEIASRNAGQDDVLIKNIKMTAKRSENSQVVNANETYDIGALKLGNMDFGSGQLAFNANDLDGKSVHEFLQTTDTILAKSLFGNKLAQLPEDTMAELYSKLPLLLKGNPKFSITPFSWKNSQGESSIDFSIALQNIPEDLSSIIHMGTEEQIRTLLQSLSLNVNLSKPMLIEQITKTAEYSGEDKNNAEATAKMQVQFFGAQGAALNIVTNTDDAIDLHLHYADDKVKFNGKESSLHQFLLDNRLIDSYDGANEQSQHDETELPAAE